MKKILLGILAFAAVACNTDVVVNESTESAITFGDSFVEVKTRADQVDPSTTTASITAFDVWGFITDTDGTIFNGTRVEKGDNGWSYEGTQWWYSNKTYYFYAVSPVKDSNIVVNTDGMDINGLGNIEFTNVDGTTDLLYAAKKIQTGVEYPYYDQNVTMQFMHLLSKVMFTFENGFATENTTMKVTNIVIKNAPAKGNVDVTEESRLDFAWNVAQGETTELVFGDGITEDDENIAAGSYAISAYERLTIPADATRTYTIEFDVDIFAGEQFGMTKRMVVEFSNQAFEIGKNYNLVATITPETFDDLKPIVFDVVVDDWTEGEFTGELDWNNEHNQQPSEPSEPEPFTPVASEWGVVGDLNGWGNDIVMYTTETENLFVAQNVEIASGSFKIRANQQWDNAKNYGLETAGMIYADKYYTVWSDGGSSNITPMEYGTYDVYFDLTNKRVALMTPGKAYAEAVEGTPVSVIAGLKDHEWGVVGSFNGWDVANYVVTVVDGDWAVAKNVTLANGDEFKFAADKAWTLSYGSACDVVADKTYATINNGGNMKFVGEAGTYDIYFSLVSAEFYMTAAANAPVEPEEPAEPEEKILTVAEFLALTDVVPSDATAEEIAAAPMYTLKGTITAVANSTYGNFDLTDETGTVLIYGLMSPDGATNKYWVESGAKLGDDITVKTIRTEYGNSPQGKNAWFVELATPGTYVFWTFDTTSVSFAAEAGEKNVNLAIYNTDAEVKVESNNTQFSAEYADGVLTVTALENTTTEKIDGVITVTCGALSQEISVSQNGASTGEKEQVTATLTFDDKTKRTAFSSTSQTWIENGVTFVNDKNKSTNAVADYVKPVRCYQGSKITVSVEGEISTIVFDCNSSSYATALKNSIGSTAEVSVSSDKVTVTLKGESSFTIEQLTAQSRIDAVTVTYMK